MISVETQKAIFNNHSNDTYQESVWTDYFNEVVGYQSSIEIYKNLQRDENETMRLSFAETESFKVSKGEVVDRYFDQFSRTIKEPPSYGTTTFTI